MLTEFWFKHYRPQRGDVIVDVGAGRGEDLEAFSQAVGPDGHVWAFESDPDSYGEARRVARALRNVTCLHLACMDRGCVAYPMKGAAWESNYLSDIRPSAESPGVIGTVFDDFARRRGIDQIDLLKVNIEGAERLALLGMRSALLRAQNAVVCAHDFRAERGEGEQFRTLDFVLSELHWAGFATAVTPGWYHVHGWRA